jgi:hypothetical protein
LTPPSLASPFLALSRYSIREYVTGVFLLPVRTDQCIDW